MINEMIKELRKIDDISWGLYAFRRDPLDKKISDEDKVSIINEAIDCGCMEAKMLREKYGEIDCSSYAEKLNIDILEVEAHDDGSYILFAKFNDPNKVSVYMESVRKAEALVQSNDLKNLICRVNIKDVLIAHEMFHFIESQKNDIYTRNKKIQLWKIGPIKYKSGLVVLGEIAAMAFAKELLQLDYSPHLFDVLLLYAHNESQAKEIYNEIVM
jgi:hypothetical protein